MLTDIASLASQFSSSLALAGLVLIVGFLTARSFFRDRPLGRFLCRLISFACFTYLLAAAGVVPTQPTTPMASSLVFIVISVLKSIWWLAAAWLLSGLVRAVLVYKRHPRETRLLQDLVAGFVYVSAVLAIIAFVFDTAVTGLLAASGVLAIVLGLALQSTLGDVFSGIVLNFAKPYHSGDWVIIDGNLQGRVIETNWRATHILNDNSDLVIVPNSVVAKAKLVNASHPTKAHGVTITIRLDPTIPPLRGCAVLETALLSCNRILRAPAPSVAIRGLDALSLECDLQFSVPAIEQVSAARNELFDLLYRHCTAANIRFAPPAGSSFALTPRETRQDGADTPLRLLTHLPIFASLSDDERAALAPKMKRRTYKAGEILIERDTVVQALGILSSGVLIAFRGPSGEEHEAMRLAPGDSFGQAGLLTGAPAIYILKALTKAVVYEIAKKDLAPILQERPAIAAELGQIMARREADEKARFEQIDVPDRHGENLAAWLADRVRDLFGLR